MRRSLIPVLAATAAVAAFALPAHADEDYSKIIDSMHDFRAYAWYHKHHPGHGAEPGPYLPFRELTAGFRDDGRPRIEGTRPGDRDYIRNSVENSRRYDAPRW